jgi:putative oxidoreductase
MIGDSLERYRDAGILIIRIGLGAAFIAHGWPKLAGGPPLWNMIGHAMPIPPATAWGFIGSLTEFGGGILLAAGLLFRPACVLLTIQMIVALSMHMRNGDAFGVYSHALEDGIVFLGLILIGPGKYSIDHQMSRPVRGFEPAI